MRSAWHQQLKEVCLIGLLEFDRLLEQRRVCSVYMCVLGCRAAPPPRALFNYTSTVTPSINHSDTKLHFLVIEKLRYLIFALVKSEGIPIRNFFADNNEHPPHTRNQFIYPSYIKSRFIRSRLVRSGCVRPGYVNWLWVSELCIGVPCGFAGAKIGFQNSCLIYLGNLSPVAMSASCHTPFLRVSFHLLLCLRSLIVSQMKSIGN